MSKFTFVSSILPAKRVIMMVKCASHLSHTGPPDLLACCKVLLEILDINVIDHANYFNVTLHFDGSGKHLDENG